MSDLTEATALLTLRPLNSSDARAVAQLSNELGYPSDVLETQARIEQLGQSSERLLIAAVLGEKLVGWTDALLERHLQSPDAVVIGGLIVQEGHRSHGIGRRLCQAVEEWAQSLGIALVRVRSQTKREDAHRFYLRGGYRQVKTSMTFEKELHGRRVPSP